MAVPATVSGRSGKARLGSGGSPTVIEVTGWTVREEADKLDQTSAEDGGYSNVDTGVIEATITLEGNYEIGNTLLTPIPLRAVLSDLYLYTYMEGTDVGPAYHFPIVVVISREIKSEVRGKITFSATLGNKGTFTSLN